MLFLEQFTPNQVLSALMYLITRKVTSRQTHVQHESFKVFKNMFEFAFSAQKHILQNGELKTFLSDYSRLTYRIDVE